MQKTYDECYLICSTAVYFESQNNEAEALRSWRNALDQIYYHNAYRVPANYQPKSETEKALQDSLRAMELQCKERVDLLEALKRSREEVQKEQDPKATVAANGQSQHTPTPDPASTPPRPAPERGRSGWLGQGTVHPVDYPDLSRPLPVPPRPPLLSKVSSEGEATRSKSYPQPSNAPEVPNLTPTLSVPAKQAPRESRTPSPEKKSVMLKTLRPGGRERTGSSSSRMVTSLRNRPPQASAKAATQAWGSISRASNGKMSNSAVDVRRETSSSSAATWDPYSRTLVERPISGDSTNHVRRQAGEEDERPRSPLDLRLSGEEASAEDTRSNKHKETARRGGSVPSKAVKTPSQSTDDLPGNVPLTRPSRDHVEHPGAGTQKSPLRLPKLDSDFLSYRKEYPASQVNAKKLSSISAARPSAPTSKTDPPSTESPQRTARPIVRRKAVNSTTSQHNRRQPDGRPTASSGSGDDNTSSGADGEPRRLRPTGKQKAEPILADPSRTPTSPTSEASDSITEDELWKQRVERLMKKLPKGVDEAAAKQIFNEVVIHGDEVHWDDIAGLDVAKAALKETVVYPFLRPDLFMGLREPARGMLLFGPPGTGKTMLARGVATESKSTFFAISASSLTSKYLGESEKLVRALFALAKALAPSIIFVDEIDSLLSSRAGSGEHEATRRIKTEFLIQWSDLQKAAAGREQSEKEKEKGDASRVLVLAATNLPWAIDEAARRRFVRRQYIPLPEPYVRETQLRTLLSHQKHEISDRELKKLVELTDGFSGSDITALAKDAAMGPLRSLGEKLLHMTMDEIRPIQFQDFQASLVTIRPSVSKQGLKEFEDWAKEFGERGG